MLASALALSCGNQTTTMQPSQPSMCTAQVVLKASVTHLTATQWHMLTQQPIMQYHAYRKYTRSP